MARVKPHEHVDDARVARLAKRLENDGLLVNPPLVVANGDDYVLLDGATRITALRQLGYPYAIVQVTDRDTLELQTWHHGLRQISETDFKAMLLSIPEIVPIKMDGPNSDECVCCIFLASGEYYQIESAPGVDLLDALNKLFAAYTNASQITRTLESDITVLRQEYTDLTALIVYPAYQIDQILEIARGGNVVPAGITRFIVPGRVLRLKAELYHLKTEEPLSAKNEWLQGLVLSKLENHQVRYYAEPVYLLDE